MPSNSTATPAKQATCEDRVRKHLAGRLKDIEYLWGNPDLSDASVLREMENNFGFSLTWVCPACGGSVPCKDCGEDLEGEPTEVEESDDDIREKLFEARNEYGLCFDYCPPDDREPDEDEDEDPGFFRFQLSTGGPGDEFRFFCGPGFACYRIEYWFLDWFDGAHRILRGADKRLLLSVFADFRECGSVEAAYKTAEENENDHN